MPSMVFKFLRPKRSFRQLSERIIAQLQAKLETVASEIQADFEKTTATWSHDVPFRKEFSRQAGGLGVIVSTDDEIYGYVDKGTKRHLIRSKKAGTPLAYNKGGFKAKTVPGRIQSGAGSPATGPLRRPYQVMHPGTEARRFSEILQQKWQKGLQPIMRQAVKTGIMEW